MRVRVHGRKGGEEAQEKIGSGSVRAQADIYGRSVEVRESPTLQI
jgi:hypothetical protein